MANWDQGGGCACGVNKVCDCKTPTDSSKEYNGIVINGGYINSISEPNNITISDIPDQKKSINYKYKEDQIIADFKAIIDKTYTEHYKTTDDNIECFDAWIALDDATPTFRNTALKYLWRYGKKNGQNKADLMKALHYTLMCLYNDHYKEKIKG